MLGNREEYRWQAEALVALQEAAESYVVHLFEDSCVAGLPSCALWEPLADTCCCCFAGTYAPFTGGGSLSCARMCN